MNHSTNIQRQIAIGLVLGLVITGTSLLLSGAGHGWGSASISSLALALAPVAGYVLARGSQSVTAIGLGFTVVLSVCVLDLTLLIKTAREGWEYVEKAAKYTPVVFATWLLAYIGWHVQLALGLYRLGK